MAVGPNILHSAVGKLADLLEARVDKHLSDTLRTKGTLGLTPEEAAMLPSPNDTQVANLCEALSKKYKQAGWAMAAFRVKVVNDCSSSQVQLDYSLTPPAAPAPPLKPLKAARQAVEANLAASLEKLRKPTEDPCTGGVRRGSPC